MLSIFMGVLIFYIQMAEAADNNSLLQQQQTMLTGMVTDQTGDPIAGVSVRVQGSREQARTDTDGRFSLRTSGRSGTMLISHVGYGTVEQPFGPEDTSPHSIVLSSSDQALEEVEINTGYQRISRERATGSFEFIDNELLNRSASTNLLERLDGITNSMLFDKRDPYTTRIQVRGLNTLTQHMSEPLIVVDNFPYDGSLADINPNDVADISILKDAAASSIWGARAANGVVVITTKRGVFNTPGKVSFRSNISVMERPDLFQLPEADPKEMIELETFLFEKGYFNALIDNRTSYPALTPVVEVLAAQREGTISGEQAGALLDQFATNDARRDFEKYVYRPAVNQQYSAGVSGGSENLSYYLSLGFDKNIEELVGDSYERMSFRSTTTYRPSSDFTLEVGLGYTGSRDINKSLGSFRSSFYNFGTRLMPMYYSFVDDKGEPNVIDRRYRSLFTDTAGGGQLLDWKFRPLDEISSQDQRTHNAAVIGDFSLTYRLTRFLQADLRYQYQQSGGDNRTYYSNESFYARDLINLHSVEENSGIRYYVPNDGILDLGARNQQSHNVRGQLNFSDSFGKHQLDAFIGGETRETRNTGNMYRTYGFSDVLTVANVDYATPQPTFAGIAGSLLLPNPASFADVTNRFVSLYANAGYSYGGIYHVTASVRKDASNLFGVKANNRGIPLWSLGGKWDIARESFYDIPMIPRLSFRATYGYGGNVNMAMSAFTTVLHRSGSDQPTNIPYAIISQRPNPNLRWEKTRTINLAVEFGDRQGRVAGNLEYYFKKSTDVLGMQPLDPTTGSASLLTNSAHIDTEGLDVQLRLGLLHNSEVRWDLNTNFNYVTYKVSRYLTDRDMHGYTSSGTLIAPFVGHHPYLLVSHRWAGLDPDTGDPMGYVEGELSQDYRELLRNPGEEQVIHGPALPPLFGNALNTVAYKKMALSFNITWRIGHYARLRGIHYANLFASGLTHADYARRWKNPGDEIHTDVPSMMYPNPSVNRDNFYTNSEVHVSNTSSIRLSDVRFSYDIDIPGMLSGIQAYGCLTNLNLVLWKASDRNLDPEYPDGLTPRRTIAFGLKLDF